MAGLASTLCEAGQLGGAQAPVWQRMGLGLRTGVPACSTDDYCGLLDLCFEQELHEIADALVSTGMKDLNYTTLLLDDCAYLVN